MMRLFIKDKDSHKLVSIISEKENSQNQKQGKTFNRTRQNEEKEKNYFKVVL